MNAYAALHRRLEGGLPPLGAKADAAAIDAHKKALATAIRAARSDARPGDVLTPEIQPKIRHIIHSELKGKGGRHVYSAIREDNPRRNSAVELRLLVNGPYPDNVPLSTVPPTVLLQLPQLPKELEYRFVGRDLILLDVTANLIVDYMRGVVRRT